VFFLDDDLLPLRVRVAVLLVPPSQALNPLPELHLLAILVHTDHLGGGFLGVSVAERKYVRSGAHELRDRPPRLLPQCEADCTLVPHRDCRGLCVGWRGRRCIETSCCNRR
jgi:hypothetical protein